MNNKPVAWMIDTLDGKHLMLYGSNPPPVFDSEVNFIPLYTHPVKCNKCNDTEWVCENHPDQEAHKCIHCGGAGKPCECTHPVKELTREDRLKLIGTLKWAEDLLREAGHDEAVSDAQDCLMILRKAQE
jgi:hypothetical protein